MSSIGWRRCRAGSPRVLPNPAPVVDQHAASEALASSQKLKDEVARANRASEEAAQVERQAWAMRQQEPQVDLKLASVPNTLPPTQAPWRVALAALAAGLSATVGLGMIATGAAIEPTVSSPAQVTKVLTVPILGVVPETNRINPARAARTRLLRAAWIATGLIVIFSCAAAMLLGGR